MSKEFAHLHLHTNFSMLDGAVKPHELFKRADELNIKAVAITDHGNMYGALEFAKAAVRYTDPKVEFFDFIKGKRDFKVKPIIGCEVYITEDMTKRGDQAKRYYHLVLLAKNKIGYKNLIKLVSLGYIDGLYYKPRIDLNLLKQHSDGLICLSGCYGGHIPQALDKGDWKSAHGWAKEYKSIFGDDFYIELQDHRMAEQRRILPQLRDIAVEYNIKMVATNDVHYLNKQDALMQKVLQNISYGNKISPDEPFRSGIVDGAKDKSGDYFPTDEFYLKSGDQMAALFEGYEGAITNSMEIANKCTCDFFLKEPLLPPFLLSDDIILPDHFAAKNAKHKTDFDPLQLLTDLTYHGLSKKYETITEQVKQRADYEIEVINRMGFVEYFLIVWDFIRFAEQNGVSVGPGRGSGAGSIVAYATGITKVDPLKYSLLFERFLNPDRVSTPDFDIDFCVDGREKVIKYVVDKYGDINVSQIITFSTMASKAAIKDVGRVYDRPYSDLDRITKIMPAMMGKTKIAHLVGLLPSAPDLHGPIPELVTLYDTDNGAKQIIDMAMRLEGMPRQAGIHAAGVIICKDEIYNHIPMAKNGDGIVTTQFNMNECEELGLLKMDFLGLTTLTDISETLKLIKKTRGAEVDFYNMEYDDPNVFALIGEGDTHAVFQLESEGMKRFMKDLKPSCLEDIIAGVALYRPGPMEYIGDYVKNKKDPNRITYDHPSLQPIFAPTYGIMAYQEQVIEMVKVLAGYSSAAADNVRRMIGKKKLDAMEREKEIFINGSADGLIKGCLANGVSEKTANKVYTDMIKFANYAFNKSHAAGYAFLAYQTAYLKCYYTAEFIAAVLNNRIHKTDEIANYLRYLKDKNITIFSTCINKSQTYFSVENGGVRIGLAALKGVGTGIIENVILERDKNGEFEDFEDFIKRMTQSMTDKGAAISEVGRTVMNKKFLESLIYSGAFDCFKATNRRQLVAHFEYVCDRIKKEFSEKVTGQFSFFETVESLKESDKYKYPNIPEFETAEKLAYEKAVAGVYLTAHPLEEYAAKLSQLSHSSIKIKEIAAAVLDGSALLSDHSKIELGGVLVSADTRFSKAGKEYGAGVVEDLYGTVEVLLMGDKVNKFRQVFQKDKKVTVYGKINIRDESYTIWADRIEEWDESKGQRAKKMCIYFDSEDGYKDTFKQIREILDDYPGDDEVFVAFGEGASKRVSQILNAKVLACDLLKNELLGFVTVVDVAIHD
ncbi:MAG: DNA polymerase III subunit alpha [Firmicutes bacterium]|nr:DNA polymerase III subunit alpha [Bacillota bacterium]